MNVFLESFPSDTKSKAKTSCKMSERREEEVAVHLSRTPRRH